MQHFVIHNTINDKWRNIWVIQNFTNSDQLFTAIIAAQSTEIFTATPTNIYDRKFVVKIKSIKGVKNLQ